MLPSPIELAIIEWWNLSPCWQHGGRIEGVNWIRDVTGVGFFIEPIDGKEYLPFTSVEACNDITGVDEGNKPLFGIMAFQNSGKITMIEGFCYTDAWPTNACVVFTEEADKRQLQVENDIGKPGRVSFPVPRARPYGD